MTFFESSQVRWLNTFLLAANVFVFSRLIVQANIQRLWLGIPVVLAVGIAPEMVFRHGMVMSEPLFLLLLQLAVLMLVTGRFWWAVVFAAFIPLQRYVGIVAVGSCVLYLLVHRRWYQSIMMGLLGTAPVALWMLRGSIVAGSAGREIVFHPISLGHIIDGVMTLGGRFWFVPAVLVVILITYMNRKQLRIESVPPVIRFAGIFCVVYMAFLVVSISFLDFNTPLSSRILAPVLLFGWPIITWLIDTQLNNLTIKQMRLAQLAFAIMIGGFLTFGNVRLIENNQNGVGLIADVDSAYFNTLVEVLDGRPMYSNHAGIMLVMSLTDERLADMPILNFPQRFAVITLEENPEHEQQLQSVIQQVQSGQAMIVWFPGLNVENLVTADELKAVLPYQDYDGLLIFSA